jgi:hypothetical protein
MSRSRLLPCFAFAMALAACNPVHQEAVDALGGEAPGVGKGPLHRPGQPCLLCHDGALGDPGEFSVAGTIFRRPSDLEPALGARVTLHGSDGSTFEAVTNEAGNFYVQPRQWTPTFPMLTSVTWQGQTVRMHTNVGRDGSCASCHVDPASSDSPGHVYLVLDDGGSPP